MKTNETGLFAVLAVVMAFAIGCGGGVSSDVSVSYKSSSLESSDDGSDDGADDGSDDGGGNEGATGILRGRIVFDGNPITLAPVVTSDKIKPNEREVCKANAIPNETLVLEKGGKGIANVFIYLAKAPKNAMLPEISSEPVPFDNKNCRFEPHAVFVRNGQPLNITNSDIIAHNTHTYPLRNRGISEVIKFGAETDKDRGLTVMYNKPEKVPFRVKCDFHTWMEGYQLTLNHPFAAVTKKDGSFEIKDLPTGKHTFIIWQERAGYLQRKYSVTIKEGDNNDQKDLSFGSAKFARFDGPEPKTILISSTRSFDNTPSGCE
jgi:plastocyanin